jgi:hypothetical protein
MRTAAALLGATLLAAGPLAAQDRYPLTGVVRDTALRPLPGIEVLLLSPRRSTTSDAQGRFRFDDVPGGMRHLTVRRIGFIPVHPSVQLPQAPGDTLRVVLLPAPQILPTLTVASERPGIRGVVGDTGYHAVPGALVELLGALRADTTDERGRFGFDNVKPGQYMLRVAREGYVSRLVPVELGKQGVEYSIFLNEFQLGIRDWAATNEGLIAMGELGSRLAMEPRRNRMTRADLDRYGTMALCDIPRLASLQRDRQGRPKTVMVLLRGTVWVRNAGLCGWSADELDLIEFGEDPCSDASHTIADWVGVDCRANPGRIRSFGYATVPPLRGPWVALWPRS